MAKIGKNILENLTTGMYLDSKVAYREYVQNACDQIDKAIDSGIVTPELAEVAIFIDQRNDMFRLKIMLRVYEKRFRCTVG